jgi:hypothetical protein
MAIDGYFIGSYSWLFYSWLLIAILLVVIDRYFIHGY